MNDNSLASIIINDLSSLIHRIEALPAHPEYTNAAVAVLEARRAVSVGCADLHSKAMRERFRT